MAKEHMPLWWPWDAPLDRTDSLTHAFPDYGLTHLQDSELLPQLHIQPGADHGVHMKGEGGWVASFFGGIQGQELRLLIGPRHCQLNLPRAWEQMAQVRDQMRG